MTPSRKITVHVSERALRDRVQRRLAHDGEHLHNTRPPYEHDLGEWYIVDASNRVTAAHVNLESLARELGALRPYESVTG
jgi:hypothetical protein